VHRQGRRADQGMPDLVLRKDCGNAFEERHAAGSFDRDGRRPT
jgi:hypothetical protein